LFTGRLSVNRKMPCPGFILNMALLFGFRPGTRRIPSPDFGSRRIFSPDFGSRRIFSPDSEVQSNPIISYFLILLFLICNCCFTDLGKSASPGTRRILSPDSGKCSDLLQCVHGLGKVRVPREQENPFS
jgi:hypothetical protein